MTGPERIRIDLAVKVLRSGIATRGQPDAIRLALRTLAPYCRDRDWLVGYWEASEQDNEINRGQGTTAAFNGIVRQLRKAGVWSDAPPPR